MDDNLEVLLQMRSFDVELVLIRRAMRAVWIRCTDGRSTLLVLLYGNYFGAPTTFRCQSITFADDVWIESWKLKLPRHKTMLGSKTSRVLLFHSDEKEYVVWCNKVTVVPADAPLASVGLQNDLVGEIQRFKTILTETDPMPLIGF